LLGYSGVRSGLRAVKELEEALEVEVSVNNGNWDWDEGDVGVSRLVLIGVLVNDEVRNFRNRPIADINTVFKSISALYCRHGDSDELRVASCLYRKGEPFRSKEGKRGTKDAVVPGFEMDAFSSSFERMMDILGHVRGRGGRLRFYYGECVRRNNPYLTVSMPAQH
jgi:hypothetical protein